jgi:hypothetical protein
MRVIIKKYRYRGRIIRERTLGTLLSKDNTRNPSDGGRRAVIETPAGEIIVVALKYSIYIVGLLGELWEAIRGIFKKRED